MRIKMKPTIKCESIRFPTLIRWTMLFSFVIYISLIVIKYKDILPLKSDYLLKSGNTEIQKLLRELEGRRDPAIKDPIPRDVDNGKAKITGSEKNVSRNFDVEIRKIQEYENEHPKEFLEEIFSRADINQDQFLSIQELAKWIHSQISEHIDKAVRENINLFTAIDINPRNGQVSWNEYHAYFLRMNGFSRKYISSHNKKHIELTRGMKETIMKDRARWAEAASSGDPDSLALDEFLSFTHPESSHRALIKLVEDLLEKFDRDGDEKLTEDEFSELPADSGLALDLPNDPDHTVDGGSEERRKEFRYLVDKNANGIADRAELFAYIDPQNPRYSIRQAQFLINLSDVNHDGRLSVSEVLAKMDLFLGSKMVDTESNFHDEF